MENTMRHDLGEATIFWERTRMGSTMLDTWHARIDAPVRSEHFAYVSKDIHGQWYASVHPHGRNAKPSLYARYASPERAVDQVERWARAHWRGVPEWHDPATWGVR